MLTALNALIDFLQTYNGAVTAVATVFIAVFTIVLAVVTRRQAKLTRDVIKVARDEFNATHRPKLRVRFVRHELMSVKGDVPLRMKYAIVNVGEGLAHVTEHITTIALKHGGDDPVPALYEDKPEPQTMDMATGESWNFITSKDHDINGFADFGALRGDGELTFRGKITYRGGNGISRTTAWERTYDAKLKGFRLTNNSDHEYED